MEKMSTYTTSIRMIVESLGSSGDTIYEKINNALPLIFDFDFPLYDENHRTELERKIVMHYFNREIGLETFALWKLYLNERLNLEMPYYNQLYAVEANKFDYLVNVSMTKSGNIDEKGDSNEKSGTTANEDSLDTEKIGSTKNDNLISNSIQKDVIHGDGETSYEKNMQNTGELNGTHSEKTVESGEDSNHKISTPGVEKTLTVSGGNSRTYGSKTTDSGDKNSDGNESSSGIDGNTVINSDFPQATMNGTNYASTSQQSEGENSGHKDFTNHENHNYTVDVGGSDNTITNSRETTTQNGTDNEDITYEFGKITDINGTNSENSSSSGSEKGSENSTQNEDRQMERGEESTRKADENIERTRNGNVNRSTDFNRLQNNNMNRSENYLDYGRNVSPTALMLEYRNAIINIDKMVIEMLEDLFMGIY